MSTTGRENHGLPRIFKGRGGRTGHREKCGALPGMKPYLRTIRFQGDSPLKRKENSFRGPRRRLRVRLRRRSRPPPPGRRAISAFRFGNINPIPFRGAARQWGALTRSCPIS